MSTISSAMRLAADATIVSDALPRTGLSRVAVIASYAATVDISRSLATLVTEFESGGYDVVLVRASDAQGDLRWPEWFDGHPTVVVKPNRGYDFGSWATALSLFPVIHTVPLVVLTNDSLIGPFASLAPTLDAFERSTSDVWGITYTEEIAPHLQSYWLGFRNRVLEAPSIRRFWSKVDHIDDKDEIVLRYEIGLSKLLRAEGFVSEPMLDSPALVWANQNPTTVGWFHMMRLGFPFVKSMLVKNADLFHLNRDIDDAVELLYGEKLREWI
jgi:lipopolysaccharide biosynthesis protein